MDSLVSNETNTGLIIGVDLREDSAMVSYYDYSYEDVIQMEYDNRQETFFGCTLKEMIEEKDEFAPNTYKTLTETFKDIVESVRIKTDISKVDSISVCVHDYKIETLEAIKIALSNLDLDSYKWEVISDAESFAYYAYLQKKELYLGGVGLMDFREDGIEMCRLMSKRVHNIDYIIEERKHFNSPEFDAVIYGEKTLDDIDEELCQTLNDFLEKRAISAIYLTGKGFNVNNLPQEFTKQIVCRKKAFIGQNLYTKGACYCALENLKPRVFDNTVLLSKERIMVGIELDIKEFGKDKRFRLVKPGSNWFMAERTVDFILDDIRQINLKILTADNRFDDEVIDLSDFPLREGKTTRISLNIKFFSNSRCQIVVKDLGFGDFYRSSGKVIYKDLDFAI